MLEKIKKELERQQVQEYVLTKQQEESVEYFFVKKNLDTCREKKVTRYEIVLYAECTDEEGSLLKGTSTITVYPGMEEEELARKISDGRKAAACSGNPPFAFADPVRAEPVVMPGRLSEISLSEAARQMSAALYEAEQDEVTFINSAEFFAVKSTCHILTSAGTDVAYTKYNVNGEFVVQCKAPQDVEFHQTFSYDDLNTEAIRRKAEEALLMVRDRARAKKAPTAGTYDLILSGDEVENVLSFYTMRANASMVYPGYSDYQAGKKVQGDEIRGEKLNLTLKALEPYSWDGIPMKDRVLVRDGELQTLYGTTRYCRYLSIEPTGSYKAIQVSNGSVDFEQMKKTPCLHAVKFSDFQTDYYTGYFKGEIRLAYLYDGEQTVCVTGGSISGYLPNAQKDMIFSRERYVSSSYEGPYAVRFRNISVAGV